MLKYQIVRSLIDIQMRDLLEFSHRNLEHCKFQSSQEVKKFHLHDPQKGVIGFSPKMKKEKDNLQKLLYDKFYRHYRVERMTEKARRIITDIFKVYKDNPEQLSYDIYQRNKKYSKKDKYQTICNYIARMTDRFALDEHAKLFDPYKKV